MRFSFRMDGRREPGVCPLVVCHIWTRLARSLCGSRENSQENASFQSATVVVIRAWKPKVMGCTRRVRFIF